MLYADSADVFSAPHAFAYAGEYISSLLEA